MNPYGHVVLRIKKLPQRRWVHVLTLSFTLPSTMHGKKVVSSSLPPEAGPPDAFAGPGQPPAAARPPGHAAQRLCGPGAVSRGGLRPPVVRRARGRLRSQRRRRANHSVPSRATCSSALPPASAPVRIFLQLGVVGVGVLACVGLGVCGCSGGVLLSRSLVGAVPLALGGLASGFGMGPGVSLPRCGRRDGGGVVVLGVGSPFCGGVGGLVLGCVVDAGLVGVCFLMFSLLVSPPR